MKALWMVLGALFFATMAVCIKVASAWLNTSEIRFWRGLIGVGLIGLLARYQGISLASRDPGMHLRRSMAGVTSLWAWFFAIGYLPVATAMTLNYMSGIWLAAFVIGSGLLAWKPEHGPQFLRQQGPLALAVLTGFGGVILILQPSMATDQSLGAILGLISGVSAALAYIQVGAMTRLGEPETRIVLFFGLGSAVAGLIGMAIEGVSEWRWQQAIWLLPIGLFATLGQLCMTYAYGSGATLVVACLQYLGIVFGAIFSLILFGDAIPTTGWVGMGLILVSGVAATVLRARTVPTARARKM
jgi:drug/metabolite transporter (DMT)-like permease